MISKPINITINDLSKTYQQSKGIVSVSKVFESGKLHIFSGENGSGKSTLIKCMMNLVHYQGHIEKRRYRIGYAPEHYNMPGHMTVNEFLRAIGRIKHLYQPFYHVELKTYLEMFDLSHKINEPIKYLSNGMKQKINLIQALLNQPKIIILDEPLVGLDVESQKKLIKRVIDLSKHCLVIISTHYPEKFKTKRKEIHHFYQGKIL